MKTYIDTPCGQALVPPFFKEEYESMTQEQLEAKVFQVRFVDPFALAELEERIGKSAILEKHYGGAK